MVGGGYAYLAAESDGLWIIDVRAPVEPDVVHISHLAPVHGVALGKHDLYVVDWDDGLRVLNIGDPSAPVTLGAVETPGNAVDVEVSAGIVYVADDWAGLSVFRECSALSRQSASNRRLQPDTP